MAPCASVRRWHARLHPDAPWYEGRRCSRAPHRSIEWESDGELPSTGQLLRCRPPVRRRGNGRRRRTRTGPSERRLHRRAEVSVMSQEQQHELLPEEGGGRLNWLLALLVLVVAMVMGIVLAA